MVSVKNCCPNAGGGAEVWRRLECREEEEEMVEEGVEPGSWLQTWHWQACWACSTCGRNTDHTGLTDWPKKHGNGVYPTGPTFECVVVE